MTKRARHLWGYKLRNFIAAEILTALWVGVHPTATTCTYHNVCMLLHKGIDTISIYSLYSSLLQPKVSSIADALSKPTMVLLLGKRALRIDIKAKPHLQNPLPLSPKIKILSPT